MPYEHCFLVPPLGGLRRYNVDRQQKRDHPPGRTLLHEVIVAPSVFTRSSPLVSELAFWCTGMVSLVCGAGVLHCDLIFLYLSSVN